MSDKKLQKTNFLPAPLFGIPFTVKDLYAVPNVIVSSGTQGLSNCVSHQETSAIQRLIAQGALLLGLSNTPEMGVSLETDNLVYGRTNHPLDLNYSTGGSSGGEAALIASCSSPLGVAGDHGGGARHPAHCCGVFTIRPSLGRLPQTGTIVPKRGWVALTSRIAPMARCVEDLEIALQVMQGGDGLDPYAERMLPTQTACNERIRIANLVDIQPPDFDPAIPQAIENVCTQLPSRKYLIQTIETDVFEVGASIAKRLFQADAGHGLQKLLNKLHTKEYSPQLQAWLNEQPEEQLTLDQYQALWTEWDEYKIKFLQLFQDFDIILCPVAPQCALSHGETIRPHAVWPLIRYTSSLTLTECPVTTIPCGYNSNRLPIGMQVIAKPWKDELVLTVSKNITQILNLSSD